MIMPNLTVKDVDASVAFYKDKLGFTHDMTMDMGDGKFAIVRLGSQVVIGMGSSSQDPQPPYGTGVQFMMYLPEGMNIDEYYANVQANGVTIKNELKDAYWGDRTFSLLDPDGYDLIFCVTIKQMTMEE